MRWPSSDRRDEARELVEEEYELARRIATPRAVGIALRARGLVEGGSRGIELLEESVGVLAATPDRLEHARALIDLGAAQRRAKQRRIAREPLGEGLELARRCAALALARRATDELAATGRGRASPCSPGSSR